MTSWPKFTQALLDWFQRNKRNLPWRQTRSPYAIWISEIMLQQTQVKTALPYYQAFLKKFPTLETLAESPLQDVLKSWEGLGYYSRARALHSAAREVQARYGGQLPGKREDLLSLAGIGPYTASAIASIAFGEAVPVVDGNVWRVFSRILADSSSPNQGKKTIFEFLQKIIPSSDPSSFNQAMMELGALICTPKNPKCVVCPVQTFCLAFKQKRAHLFPRTLSKKPAPHRNWIALVVRRKNKVLLRQRPLQGIWGGLWEFPAASIKNKKEMEKVAKRIVLEFSLNGQSELRRLEPIRHAFSHFKLTLHPFLVSVKRTPRRKNAVWSDLSKNRYPLPVPHSKILKHLQGKLARNEF